MSDSATPPGIADQSSPRKRPGPPRTTGPGLTIGIRLRPRLLAALDHAIKADVPGETRAGAVKLILRQWLKDAGHLS